MKALRAAAFLAVGLAAIVTAAPPGPIDGENIPANFGAGNLVATQRNYTSFGDRTVTTGALIEGNELDEMFLAKEPGKLFIGLTGNLATQGNALLIGIGIPGRVGQTELRSEGVDGPPFTVQTASREVVVTDVGEDEDPTNDTWAYGSNGTILPCETDYMIAIDVFGGTMSVSEYELLDPAVMPTLAGTYDPTPDNPADLPDADLFALRTFVTQGPTNDGNDVMENDQALGYEEGGFDNTNVLGVTGSDGSSAPTAVTGMELGIPFARLGLNGTEEIQVYVLLADGGEGSTGIITNQVLPPLGAGAPCDPPDVIGLRPDLSAVMACATVNLSTLAGFTGTAEGQISPAEYGGFAAETQTCPTPYGDQVFDPEGVSRTGGSELDAMYLDSDAANLYVGITGNLEESGNRILLFVDSVAGGESSLTWDGMGAGGSGLEGDFLPLLDDEVTPAEFDYVVAINAGGDLPNANVWVDMWDIQTQMSSYKGRAVQETGSGELVEGSNQWGMELGVYNLNDAGVIGCGFFDDPCWFDSSVTVEAAAATATSGFEYVIPLADLGLNPCEGPHDIHVWALLTGNDGWRSNQCLPSARGDGADAVWQGENNVTDWYNPAWPDPWLAYETVAATHTTTVGIEDDCNTNGIEDVCDILSGFSLDDNFNGIPDDCEITAELLAQHSCADHDGTPVCIELGTGLDKTPGDNIDPRICAVIQLQADFTAAVASISAEVACAATVYAGNATVTVAGDGLSATIDLDTMLPDEDCCTVTLSGDVDAAFTVRTLKGDVDRNGQALGSDMLAVKPNIGAVLSSATARFDVDCSGQILGSDMLAVKPYIGGSAPSCP